MEDAGDLVWLVAWGETGPVASVDFSVDSELREEDDMAFPLRDFGGGGFCSFLSPAGLVWFSWAAVAAADKSLLSLVFPAASPVSSSLLNASTSIVALFFVAPASACSCSCSCSCPLLRRSPWYDTLRRDGISATGPSPSPRPSFSRAFRRSISSSSSSSSSSELPELPIAALNGSSAG